MIGIVLAGGLATRLNNKPLLWTPEGPMMFHAFHYLSRLRGELSGVVITCPPGQEGIYRRITKKWPRFQCYTTARIMSDDYSGIPEAIRMAHLAAEKSMGRTDDQCIVVCGDNIYPDCESPLSLLASSKLKEFAVCRSVDMERIRSLAVRYKGEYKRASQIQEHELQGTLALTTPWVLTRESLFKMSNLPLSVEDWFTDLQIPHVQRPTGNWMDVGTPEAYEQCLRSLK